MREVEAGGLGRSAAARQATDIAQRAESLGKVFEMIDEMAVGHRGRLTSPSATLDVLRKEETRLVKMREFVLSILPAGASPAIWLAWLQGGPAPYSKGRPARPESSSDANSGRLLFRTSGKREKAEMELRAAKRALELAQKRAAEAEAAHDDAVSKDAAIIEWAVSTALSDHLGAVFAMGPAWTLMRAVSAYISPEQLEQDLRLIKDRNRRDIRAQALKQERQEESEELLTALDQWAGDIEFEVDLRHAIQSVVKTYNHREPPRLRRSRSGMKTSLSDPELARGASEIVEGVARHG